MLRACWRCLTRVSPFVRGSAGFSSDDTLFATRSPSSIRCLMKWYFLSMCLDLPWSLGSLAKATALSLSQKISIGSLIAGTTPRSPMKFFSHIASFAASLAAIYSHSQVESAIVSCLELFQEIAPPFRVKTQPDWERKLSLSVWKLASLYPTTLKSSLPPRVRTQSLVLRRYLRIFFTAVQCALPGFAWYLLTMLRAKATLGRVHVIAYMVDPTAEA